MRSSSVSTFRTIALFAAVAFLLVGCGTKQKQGGTFRYAVVGGDPGALSPFDLGTSDATEIAKNLYDGLVDYDPDTADIKPAVAESWSHNHDFTEWTFKLKKGLKFSNGEPITAESFIKAWDVTTNPKNESSISYHFSTIDGFDEMQEAGGKIKHLKGVSAPDDLTIKVKLSRPDNVFDYRVGHPAFSPIPIKAFKRMGKKAFDEKPIGNGPFVVRSFKHDRQVVVTPNPNYETGEKPKLDKVVFKIYAEGGENAAFKDFQAKKLDETEVPLDKIQKARKDPRWDFHEQDILATYYFGLLVDHKPWKGNVKLRQAAAYAINRPNIVDNVWNGAATVATGIVPPGVPGYEPGGMPYKYDPQKAKELLSEAGFPGGKGLKKLTLGYNTGAGHEDVAAAVQADLKRVGIDVDTKGFAEFTTQYIPKLMAGDLAFFRLGWVADYPVQDNFIFPLLYGPNAEQDNLSNFKDPEIDKKIEAAQAEPDRSKRESEYREIEKDAMDQVPLIPIFFYKSKRVTWDNVEGYVRSVLDDTPLEQVSFKG